MSAPDVLVHTELDGETYLVGHLWIRESRQGTFGATFQYGDSWLEKKESFAVDPLLPIVSPGPYHKERLFGAIADSAPAVPLLVVSGGCRFRRWGSLCPLRSPFSEAALPHKSISELT